MVTTFKTKAPKADNREIEVSYDFGENVNDMIERFGAEVVQNAAIAQIRIDLQSIVRGMLEDGKTNEEILTKVAEWKPGVKVNRERSTKAFTMDQVMSAFEKLTPEQKVAYITALRSNLAASAAPAPEAAAAE